ncbi:hypothetical protein ACK9YZ_03195 [Rhizobium sp. ZK1]|uniref:hypothetical protein n=1 Tax=Rhizobium sp. ZK1 TaxID=3389872 RepID=UPI0039F66392
MSVGTFGPLAFRPTAAPDGGFHYWQGQSLGWWITTVYPLFADFPPISSVYVMVKRNQDGTCAPIYIGQTDNLRRRMMEHSKDKVLAAYKLGATQLHAHFIANTATERFAVETDLRNGHKTPLNEQPSAAFGGLIGLGNALMNPQPRSFLDSLVGVS